MANILKEIKDAIVKRKEVMFKDFLEDIKTGKTVEPISMEDLEKREETEFKLTTGTLLDEILGGGVPEGKSMLLYGELASGKTQTCLTATALCPNGIIYIDAESSLRAKRMREICETRGLDWDEIRKKVVYFNPQNWADQLLTLFSVPSPSDVPFKIDLIICDSISKHFRGIEFVGRENLQIKNGLIREFILALERLAKMHRAALIYTTQIYDKPSVTPFSGVVDIQKPVGGRSAEHQPDFVVFFRKGKGNIRIARMMDSSWNPLRERPFVLNEKGIDDIPETAPAYKTQKIYADKFTKKQAQEDITKKTRKKKDDSAQETTQEPAQETQESPAGES